MEVDLNDFTLDDVRQLIASGTDSIHTQLRVTKDGRAFLSEQVGDEDVDDSCFRFETWASGSNHLGPDAAKDYGSVKRIYNALKDNWPNPKAKLMDSY